MTTAPETTDAYEAGRERARSMPKQPISEGEAADLRCRLRARRPPAEEEAGEGGEAA